MQDPQQTHQDNDTRSLPLWYQRFRMGPLGPLGLCAIALGFIALLISGRLRMLYPMPRTVVASPQTEPSPPTPSKPARPSEHYQNKVPARLLERKPGEGGPSKITPFEVRPSSEVFETSTPK